MKLYLFIIGVAMTAIAGINVACGVASSLYAAVAVVFCVALQIVLDSLAALAVRLTPDRLYPAESPRYRVRPWEKKLYLKLGVRVWKDHIPDLEQIFICEKQVIAGYFQILKMDRCRKEPQRDRN